VAQNRVVAEGFIPAIDETARTLFLPIREYAGPLTVSSFFRYDALNEAVGGSSGSQHRVGEAFDIVPSTMHLVRLFEWIAYESKLQFGQCLLEGYGNGAVPKWIHVSVRGKRAPGKCDMVGRGPSNAIVFDTDAAKIKARGGVRWA
jgi:hypothetical protein